MNGGYFPGIATIGKLIVYLENQDGNANVKIDQSELLTRCYQLLNKHDIQINRSRMDAGSYSKEIMDAVSKYGKLFYIRANRSADMTEQIRQITDWKTVEINFKKYQVYYNQRGESEKLFDIQNNDFGWSRLLVRLQRDAVTVGPSVVKGCGTAIQ